LGGCSGSYTRACPPVVQYDGAFKAQMGKELHQLGEESATARFVEDSVTLREQVKACR